jgi:ribosome maturation factor RimP
MALEIEQVREIAERVGASSGLEIVDVEMRGGGNKRMLRIVIDRRPVSGSGIAGDGMHQGGVTHEDCANLSREVGTILDVEGVIPGGSYVLEVSSPGLDRKLLRPADFERFVGSRVKLTTREPIQGNRNFDGRLEGFQDGRLTLAPVATSKKRKQAPVSGSEKIEIEFSNIEKANLVPEI